MNKEPSTHGQSKYMEVRFHDDYIYIITNGSAFVKPLERKTRENFTGFSFRGKDDITALSLFAAVRIYIITHRARIVKGV